MGKLPNPDIVFFKKQSVYSPGDIIKGKVILDVDSDGLKKVKGIWVQFTGTAKCEFTTGSGQTEESHEETERYFNSCIVVFGTGKGQASKPDLTLPPGRSSFPFTFRVPAGKSLPSPFEGRHGYVRYSATATLSILRMILNKENRTNRSFTVAGPTVDLNHIPGLKPPVSCQTDVRNLWGLGFKQGATVTFGLRRRGYVPGQSIAVSGRVDNREGDEQRNVEATLVQETTFLCKELFGTASKTTNRVLSRRSASVVCPRGKVTNFAVGQLQIPCYLPSSGMPGCSIMDVQYYVKCNSPGCIETTFRMTIGTVALRAPARVPTAPAEEALPSTSTPEKSAGPPTYANAPSERGAPPTYKEAMQM